MKLSILLRTSEYRGDHAADIAVAHETVDNETVCTLVERLLPTDSKCDWIEIRRVAPHNKGESK